MKKYCIIVFLCLSVLLTGCTGNVTENSSSSLYSEVKSFAFSEICEQIAESIELPVMGELTDKELLADIFDINDSSISDYYVYQQLVNISLCEIILIRTTDTAKVTEMLEKRKDDLINVFSWYPEQKQAAEATIVGSKNDVCYLVASVDSDKVVNLLLQKI